MRKSGLTLIQLSSKIKVVDIDDFVEPILKKRYVVEDSYPKLSEYFTYISKEMRQLKLKMS